MEDAMNRTFAAAIFALLIIAAPARAADILWYQIDTINLRYSNNLTLTGNLDIIDGAPSVPNYLAHWGSTYGVPFANSTLSLNGSPLVPITGGPGFLYTATGVIPFADITYPVPPCCGAPGAPTYGTFPLLLSPYDIALNRTPSFSGSVNTESCSSDGTNTTCTNLGTLATPLPPALPMFGAALLALGGLAWRSRRQQRG
jgi:hypothetical protein